LEGADLTGATFDKTSRLDRAELTGTSLDQVTFDNMNLTVVDWSLVPMLGDEVTARSATFTRDATIGTGVMRAAEFRANVVREKGDKKERFERRDEFSAAVRANRVLAVTLRSQGLNEDADRYGYRAYVLQRQVLIRQGHWLRYLGALFLDTISGHGYRPGRSLLTYLAIIASFAAGYYLLGGGAPLHLTPQEAVFTSIISFHGRGFFPTSFNLANPITPLVAAEAICGLLIEITFIATFTNRFFAR
jgi:hypothetical protein